jgi:hypothetical protein
VSWTEVDPLEAGGARGVIVGMAALEEAGTLAASQ